MATIADLVARLRREHVEPADQRPTVLTLDGALSAGATNLNYDPALLGPEEKDLLGPGTLIEIDWDGTNEAEEILVGGIDADGNELSSLARGQNGTSDVAHDDGATIRVEPTFTRKRIRDAIADSIEGLWPDLYAATDSDELTVQTDTFTEAPADARGADWFLAKIGGASTNYQKVPVRFFNRFPPSTTGRAFYAGASGGTTGYLMYRKKFTRPSAETDDLQDDLDLEDEWERLVIVSTVAYLISGRDLQPAFEQRLADQLARQNFPVGSGESVRDSLLRYEQHLRQKAKNSLLFRDGVLVQRHGVSGG